MNVHVNVHMNVRIQVQVQAQAQVYGHVHRATQRASQSPCLNAGCACEVGRKDCLLGWEGDNLLAIFALLLLEPSNLWGSIRFV